VKAPPAAYRVANSVRRVYWRLFNPVTIGVRIAAIDNGKVLLVRHTYMRGWYLPGGGLKAGETLEQAARRELREETGLRASNIALVGAFTNMQGGQTDHVLLFLATPEGEASPSSPEIAECRWFALDALPEDCPPGTRRRLGALDGQPMPTGRW